MIKPTLYEWTALSQRLDGFLATHDRFAKLPSDAVNGAQQRAMLVTAISLAKDMLSFRDAAQTSTPGASLPSGNDKRIQDIIKGGLESGNLRSAFVAELTILLSLMRNGLDAYFNDGQEVLRLRGASFPAPTMVHCLDEIRSQQLYTRIPRRRARVRGAGRNPSLVARDLRLQGDIGEREDGSRFPRPG